MNRLLLLISIIIVVSTIAYVPYCGVGPNNGFNRGILNRLHFPLPTSGAAITSFYSPKVIQTIHTTTIHYNTINTKRYVRINKDEDEYERKQKEEVKKEKKGRKGHPQQKSRRFQQNPTVPPPLRTPPIVRPPPVITGGGGGGRSPVGPKKPRPAVGGKNTKDIKDIENALSKKFGGPSTLRGVGVSTNNNNNNNNNKEGTPKRVRGNPWEWKEGSSNLGNRPERAGSAAAASSASDDEDVLYDDDDIVVIEEEEEWYDEDDEGYEGKGTEGWEGELEDVFKEDKGGIFGRMKNNEERGREEMKEGGRMKDDGRKVEEEGNKVKEKVREGGDFKQHKKDLSIKRFGQRESHTEDQSNN